MHTISHYEFQAMASLSYLQPYLAAAHYKAVQLDVASPVIDALLALLQGQCGVFEGCIPTESVFQN
jgi:hypothetical protein